MKMTTNNPEILARAGMVLTGPSGSDSSSAAACASFHCKKMWQNVRREKKKKSTREGLWRGRLPPLLQTFQLPKSSERTH